MIIYSFTLHRSDTTSIDDIDIARKVINEFDNFTEFWEVFMEF